MLLHYRHCCWLLAVAKCGFPFVRPSLRRVLPSESACCCTIAIAVGCWLLPSVVFHLSALLSVACCCRLSLRVAALSPLMCFPCAAAIDVGCWLLPSVVFHLSALLSVACCRHCCWLFVCAFVCLFVSLFVGCGLFVVLVCLFVCSGACLFLCLLGFVCLVLRGCSDVCACVMWLFGWFYLFVFLSLWLVSIVVYVLVVCVFACVRFVLWVECVLFCLFVWLCVCISLGFACHGFRVSWVE